MNNLKFRAYIKSIQKIVDVTKIDLNNKMLTLDIATNKVCIPYWWKETELAFSQVIIMQSTGLFDKNGKEIFEGDIVNCGYLFDGSPFSELDEYEEEKGVVKFVNCGFNIKFKNDTNLFIDIMESCEAIVVIGNIYEDKELMR
jgi:hypothetical protein|nr:MAG TPA: YopX protein [Caudoviricetes sp.]